MTVDQTFQKGDKVRCHRSGSWVDQKIGVVINPRVCSSDSIWGAFLQMDEETTVVPTCDLELVERGES